MTSDAAIPAMSMRGVVLNPERTGGCVILEVAGGGCVFARPGVAFNTVADGESRTLTVQSISADGIEISAPQKETVRLPILGSLRGSGGAAGELDYVELRKLPHLDALRMLGDQSGRNFSASVEANKILVNGFVSNGGAT